MGLKRPDAPDLIYGIQPVQIVSNAEDSVARVFAPSALVGGNVAAEALEVSLFKMSARVPTRVVFGGGKNTFSIVHPGPGKVFGALGPVACTPQLFDPDQPLTGTFETGSTLTLPTVDEPQFGAGLGTPGMYAEFWIPAGGVCDITTNAINDKTSFWAVVYETPSRYQP